MSDTAFTALSTKIRATWLNVQNALAYYGRSPSYAASTGTANAYVLTLTATSLYAAYVDGDEFTFKANFANTAAATLRVVGASSLANTDIYMGGAALSAGQIQIGDIVKVRYDGTRWQIVGGTPLARFTQSGTAPISRTAQDKLREIERTPQDHAAVADGSTNDATAFANAIASQDAANNGEVKVPAETYRLTSGITMPTLNDLVGAGRWATRLEFALTSTGTCVSLEGADTNNRVRSSLRRMRIDGEDCTDSAVTGVLLNWNQQQQPILDEVTIYGGYSAGGANTGLKYGLVFKEDGSVWSASIDHLAIEGCHNDGLVMDTASGGAHNIINFNDCRIENNKGRNVYIVGPNDDIATAQINFYGCTFEFASYQTTGVTADFHIEGALNALVSGCWFESAASPNWPTYEIYVPSGRLGIHNCNIAWAQTGVYCGGAVTFTGKNTIRSANGGAGIHIPTGGTCNIEGEAVTFLGSGTPITYAGTGTLNWNRSKTVVKTGNYTITTADIGCKFTNEGSRQNITFTLPDAPTGSHVTIVNGATSIRNSTWRWTASGSGTNEYYLELAAGGDPGFSQPTSVYDFTSQLTSGTPGTLAAARWGYGDNDTLGFSTIYVRLSDGVDPDARSVHALIAGYTVTVTPNSRRIAPQGGTATDSMVSDGVVGTSVTLRCFSTTFWQMEGRAGTWT